MGWPARVLGVARSAGLYYGVPLRNRRMRRFYGELVQPGDLCFDVGAHLGNRTRCWRALGARVVAIEPQQDFFRILQTLYGRDPAVTLVRCALGRHRGETELYVSERHPTVTSVSAEWLARVKDDPGFEAVEWTRTETVALRTLDMLIAEFGEPRFVKIDVEGHEPEVLRGLTTPLAALSFECLPAVRDLALACIDRLDELGDYRYGYSSGERHRLIGDWLDADGMRRFIAALPVRADSGDVYARRAGTRFRH